MADVAARWDQRLVTIKQLAERPTPKPRETAAPDPPVQGRRQLAHKPIKNARARATEARGPGAVLASAAGLVVLL